MIKTIVLENGLKIVLETMPFFKSAGIGIWVNAGSSWENENNNGIAHVIEHMLFKGTSNRDGKKIAEEMMALGGEIDAYTSRENSCFYTSLLGENVPDALEIIIDLLLNPLLKDEDLEKEKSIISEEIDMYDDDPAEHVHEQLENAVWKNSSYGYYVSGNKENVNAFTSKDLKAFLNSHYTPERTVISVCGCFDEEMVVNTVKRLYKGAKNAKLIMWPEKPEYYKSFVCEKKDVEQIHIDICFEGMKNDHKDRYVLAVVNNLLGGNMNARLFRTIREEMGLVYSIYSYTCAFKDCGLFCIYAAANPENMQKVISRTWNIIEGLKEELIDESELSLIKRVISSDLIIGSESPRSRMDNNGRQTVNGYEIVTLEEKIAGINAVTSGDIQRIFKEYFTMDKLSISLSGSYKDSDAVWVRKNFGF